MIKVFLILFQFIYMYGLPFEQQVDYGEIQALGGSCPSFDRCSSDRKVSEDNLFNYTCECKPSCNTYGTCCVDSPNNRMHLLNDIPSWPDTAEESCHYLLGAYKTLVVRHKCKPNWQHDQEIKSLCEAISYSPNYEDPLAATPVTNSKTSTTYKNYFCVLCNDDDVDDLVFWNVKVTKYMPESKYEEEKKKFEDNSYKPPLTFNNVTKEWGTIENVGKDPEVNSMSTKLGNEGSDQKVFEGVSMFFKYPPSLSESIVSCSQGLITNCHPNWKDETVRRKCHSYMGMIYSDITTDNGLLNTQRFRNIHCAICNFAGNNISLKCFFHGRCGCEIRSISWLVNVNRSKDYRLEVKGCVLGEVYDPFFENCRTMKCIKSGHTLRNGKCQPS